MAKSWRQLMQLQRFRDVSNALGGALVRRAAAALAAGLEAHVRLARQRCPAAGAQLTPEQAVLVRPPAGAHGAAA